jgi:hypothetical protein
MKKIFQILIIICSGLLLNSCYYDELVERPVPEIPVDPTDPGYVEIKYGAQIQPIFNSKCTTCHNASHQLDLREGVSYNELVPDYVIAGDADGSILYLTVNSGHGGASSDDKSLIKGWINQGAKNN